MQKSTFAEIVLYDFGVVVLLFWEALGAVVLVFCTLQNRFENRLIVGVETDLEPRIWRGGSTMDLGLIRA